MSSCLRGLLVTVVTLCLSTSSMALWWVTDGALHMKASAICQKARQLNVNGRYSQQVRMCTEDYDTVREIAKGAKLSVSECQFQFRYGRWNCTNKYRSISKTMLKDTRESVFLRAISSAGALFGVTQACSMGQLQTCGCLHTTRQQASQGQGQGQAVDDTAPKAEWVWGGCSDDVDFGYRKSAQFMDVGVAKGDRATRRVDGRTRILLHNNEAGRLALHKHTRLECKCHGMSGSCTMRHCWKRMPTFREVGDRLKVRFDGATQVTVANNTATGSELVPAAGMPVKHPNPTDLVYTDNSVDYCKKRRKSGSLGTRGRICNDRLETVGGCDVLCCGRGYYVEKIKVQKNCNCRFRWCCEVQCQTCVETVTVNRCS